MVNKCHDNSADNKYHPGRGLGLALFTAEDIQAGKLEVLDELLKHDTGAMEYVINQLKSQILGEGEEQ